MKIVYLIGPYRGSTPWVVTRNIERAREVAAKLWALGIPVICPHTNTGMMDGVADDNVFLRGDLEMLRRCDAALVIGNIARSEGSQGEVLEANRIGIPVFNKLNDLYAWYMKGE